MNEKLVESFELSMRLFRISEQQEGRYVPPTTTVFSSQQKEWTSEAVKHLSQHPLKGMQSLISGRFKQP